MNWGDEDDGAGPSTGGKQPKPAAKAAAAAAAKPNTAAKAAADQKAAKYAADDDEKPLPPDEVIMEANLKTVISYARREDGRLDKKTTKYVLEKKSITVSKAVMERRNWAKFGVSKGLGPGPDSSSTNTVSDDIFLTLGKEEIKDDADEEKSLADKLQGKKLVMCRICKGDHWTTKCPYKDKMDVTRPDGAMPEDGADEAAGGPPSAGGAEPGGGPAADGAPGGVNSNSRYVPVHQRAGRGGEKSGSSMNDRDDSNTIRVTNISENTREDDLRDLFKSYGHISRCYLATDRITGAARGFAFINFMRKDDAQAAIDGVNGHGYDHLILQVEWAEERTDAKK